MTALHPIDIAIILGYLAAVVILGKVASKQSENQEGFFLAGRTLGRIYQFFLNFGNATDAIGAVSTASAVYRQGAAGTWIGFQNIFLNPYYWFMNSWFRRVRLTTTADLFEDRMGSRRLGVLYAVYQIFCVVVLTGFGNLVAYKITSAIIVKPESAWTQIERQSVEGYQELARLEKEVAKQPLAPADATRLGQLREAKARDELRSQIPAIEPWTFYLLYTAAVGIYVVLGGMKAAALNEALQGLLIIAFSIILIPAGLAAIGGWGQLAERVPDAMFWLFGNNPNSEITTWGIGAMFLTALLQVNGLVGNMSIAGSARNETAARMGAVTGTFAKRLLMILWTFAGLIAVALYAGDNALSDPDAVWGLMSRQLLGPGMLGLMLAGIIAANMSTVAAQTMAISALFARNVYSIFRPVMIDGEAVRAARWFIVVVLLISVLAATWMKSVYVVLQVYMTLNVSFGTAVLLMFFWRRLTIPAIWTAVVICTLVNTILPLVASQSSFVRDHPALTVRAQGANGQPVPVYFESVAAVDPAQPGSRLEGRGRLHCELILLSFVGVDVPAMTPGARFAARFYVDALLPPLLLIGLSLLSRPPERKRLDQFYGKMRTPVGATPALEDSAMEETRLNPQRFDHLKLWPRSSWEFSKWDRMDAFGFLISCALVGVIIALFWGLLRWAAP